MSPSSFSPAEAETSMAMKVSKGIDPATANAILGFFEHVGVSDTAVDGLASTDDYSAVLCRHLKPLSVERRRVSCSLSVKPAISNFFNGAHGGAIAAVAERASMACARTLVSEDKDLFLGELSISYLSAVSTNSELIVEAYIVRSGRNVTVVAVEFIIKDSTKLAYLARATFYNSPVSKL